MLVIGVFSSEEAESISEKNVLDKTSFAKFCVKVACVASGL